MSGTTLNENIFAKSRLHYDKSIKYCLFVPLSLSLVLVDHVLSKISSTKIALKKKNSNTAWLTRATHSTPCGINTNFKWRIHINLLKLAESKPIKLSKSVNTSTLFENPLRKSIEYAVKFGYFVTNLWKYAFFYVWIDFSCVYSTRLRATMILYHMLCAIVLLTLCAIATATIERRKKTLTIMLQGDKWSNHFKVYLWKYIWSQSCFFLFENQNKTRLRRTITSNRFCMIYEPVKLYRNAMVMIMTAATAQHYAQL